MSIPKEFIKKKRLPVYFSSKLSGYYDDREARNLASWVIEHLTGKSSLEIMLGNEEWGKKEEEIIEVILERLQCGNPIQQILGYTEFFGLKLDLDPEVLIPRNETEELVEWVLTDKICTTKGCKILDIGCGSGAISLALSKSLPDAMVYAVDVSDKALKVSIMNAERLMLNFCCGKMDILNPSGIFSEMKYDVIISNPPYVLESQKPLLESRVSEKEPSIALFVPDNDPLLFYRAISEFADKRLKPGGGVYVEINEQLPQETMGEFDKRFAVSELRKDIHGRYRMIKASNGKK